MAERQPQRVGTRAAIFVCALLGAVRTEATTYTFVPLEVPGSSRTVAAGINDAGDVVGSYTDASGVHGFLLRSGVYTTLDAAPLEAGATQALGVNDTGQIVGTYLDLFGNQAGFVWDGASYERLPGAGVDTSLTAVAINDAGQIVASTFTAAGAEFAREAFLLSGGERVELVFPGSSFTQALGINDAGTIVGYASNANGFLLSGGRYSPLDVPFHAQGVNDAGDVLGDAFVLSEGVLTALAFPGASSTRAYGINDAGLIVGEYVADGATRGFLAIPVPEPSIPTLAPFVLASVVAARGSRRRTRGRA